MALSLKKNALPLLNFSAVQPSDASGSEFNPVSNGRVRIKLPATLGVIDPHNSYLKFDFELTAPNYKMIFGNGIGAQAIIKDLRISVGGRVVEELAQLPVLARLQRDYGRDLSTNQLDGVQYLSCGSANPLQESSTVGVSPVKVQICMQPKWSGFLTARQAMVLSAMGNCEIEFTLAPANEVLQQARGSSDSFDIAVIPNGVFTHVDILEDDADNEPYNKYWNDENDCLFAVGSRIKITTDRGDKNNVEVTAVAKSGNRIRLSFASQTTLGADTTTQSITLVAGTDGNAAVSCGYKISKVEYVANIIEMPPQMAEAMAKGGMIQYDIPTYQTLISQAPADVPLVGIDIPTAVSRAKALFCVPMLANGTKTMLDDGTAYRLAGSYNDLRNYQWQLSKDGKREPSRPVDTQNMATSEKFAPQEHLFELEKAFRASSVGVRSLREYADNFVCGRSLSAYGGSTDLSLGGARLYLEYLQTLPRNGGNNTITAKNIITFVHHIKRMTLTSAGCVVES